MLSYISLPMFESSSIACYMVLYHTVVQQWPICKKTSQTYAIVLYFQAVFCCSWFSMSKLWLLSSAMIHGQIVQVSLFIRFIPSRECQTLMVTSSAMIHGQIVQVSLFIRFIPSRECQILMVVFSNDTRSERSRLLCSFALILIVTRQIKLLWCSLILFILHPTFHSLFFCLFNLLA